MSQHAIDAYLDDLLCEVEPAALPPHPAAVLNAVPDVVVAAPPPPAPEPPVARTMPAPVAPSPRESAAAAPSAIPEPRHRRASDTAPVSGEHVPTAARSSRWLRMGIGRDSYAFELLRVQEVVRVAPILAVRGASMSVLGVMNLRGRIVPVFDLGRWLGSAAIEVTEGARIVVVERDDELIGVLVTQVEDVVSLSREHIEPPLANGNPGAIVGIARTGHAPTVLLDANALFD
ncbi:chemotaxis protein CheW [Novilysobacter selenitireducens]|uniref:Chemotaxis protein CheW n=1 Tax=Novilysobacter selenitireducens TaxID=2872639 RepID=A0ABS7T990_9GAMM|nr:chemotaxis protein CheW [Lysobacter selenitireducens]MBZ4040468.1 chemotaxis protein CheW [Lysobacter selenitireducens]